MKTPKPFFRKQTKSWYVSIDGKFHPLGKNEKEAFEQYYVLMSDRQPTGDTTPDTKVRDLLKMFLAWCKGHRDAVTHDWYKMHLSSFEDHISPKLTLRHIKAFHVTKWLDDEYAEAGDTYKNGAVRAVMRAFNWAAKQGHILANPVKGVERPAAESRVAYLSAEQWNKFVGKIEENDPFHDFVVFLRETGCRPQEARHIEARHFDRHNQLTEFPIKESKGKKEPRVIPLNDRAMGIITRLAMKYPEGKLFRNKRGNPWKAFAITNRFTKLRKKLGFKTLFAYAIRHTFITDALIRGVDAVTLACIVGHKDATMILKVYQHVKLNTGHVRAALALATGEVAAKKIASA